MTVSRQRIAASAAVVVVAVASSCSAPAAHAFSTSSPLSRASSAASAISTSSALRSSALPIPTVGETTVGSPQQQMPELGEDDLYLEPPVQREDPPKAGTVMKMLPSDTWDVDTPTSLMYFAVDMAAVVASMGFLNAVVTSELYHSFPLWGQALSVAPLQVLTGFAMWCTWCIGHDAGHGTVSKDGKFGSAINRIVGEITHSMVCLTPFVPWAKSHKKHHLHHNHLTRDYSHQWFIREEADSLHPAIKISHLTRNLQLPVLYFVYLFLGVPDGGHVLFYGRMWENESLKEKANAALSVVVSMATAGTLWANMGTADFAVVCMAPWLVLSFWLFMVTYLQHHSDDGKLYTDETYTFERGAFETVDRNYGKWVNRMSHHMMDGHVVHHLFFNRVPHYRLEAATEALQVGMKERGQEHMYKRIETPDFSQEIVKQFDKNWFFVNEEQVVRKW